MKDARFREPVVDEPLQPAPWQAIFLTAPPERAQPK
jgi:hypothetical protein